jgi:three-Cys-motif partner protein
MAVPTDVLWERDPHTAAKHTLLRRYLSAWFPIMAKQFRDDGITFLDGFAGPGEYTNSQESSPAIAMTQAMRNEVVSWGARTRLVFIEDDRRRAEHLKGLLDVRFPRSSRPAGLVSRVHHGKCGDLYEQAIAEVGGWAGPVFANLDGWGADTNYEIVQRMAQQKSSEVLVTFKDQFFIRFANGSRKRASASSGTMTGGASMSSRPPRRSHSYSACTASAFMTLASRRDGQLQQVPHLSLTDRGLVQQRKVELARTGKSYEDRVLRLAPVSLF